MSEAKRNELSGPSGSDYAPERTRHRQNAMNTHKTKREAVFTGTLMTGLFLWWLTTAKTCKGMFWWLTSMALQVERTTK